MPPFVAALLLKYGVPLAIYILENTGFTNWAEKVAIKAGYAIYTDAKGIKVYSAPEDYPHPPAPPASTNNLSE
jgi:hypothetical protein